MAIFEGAGVALVTPFAKTGEINYEKLEELVEEQIAGGTDCIVAMGTTGESATTTEEEHLQAIRFICQAVKGRCRSLPEPVPTVREQRWSFRLRRRKRERTACFWFLPIITKRLRRV